MSSGTLIRRYQRFLADIRLDSGEQITAHCPNSGSMRSCNTHGSQVMLSFHPNPKRKYQYTWEMIRIGSTWVGINTMLPNKVVADAIKLGKIPELVGFHKILTEQKIGNSRLDLVLEADYESCYIEIKNVTLVQNRVAMFPDSPTKRGVKHLNELIRLKRAGKEAVIFFLIQRSDCEYFAPADHIDPEYEQVLREANVAGVKILPYQARVSPEEISIHRRLDSILKQ
ncbi:MAG TPA: DNA/RNA nuclease SfsA [bacterium]|nr:DNA/RNA nuclease SfsA [bacterium]